MKLQWLEYPDENQMTVNLFRSNFISKKPKFFPVTERLTPIKIGKSRYWIKVSSFRDENWCQQSKNVFLSNWWSSAISMLDANYFIRIETCWRSIQENRIYWIILLVSDRHSTWLSRKQLNIFKDFSYQAK